MAAFQSLHRRCKLHAWNNPQDTLREWKEQCSTLQRPTSTQLWVLWLRDLLMMVTEWYEFYLFTDNASSRGSSSAAHAKGIFFLNAKSGFYLSHSVPRFLDLKQKSFQYPDSGRENGQVLICISLAAKDSTSILNIGQHLLLLKTNVYAHNLTDAFTKKYPAFKDLIDRKWSKNQTQISEIYSSKRYESAKDVQENITD